MLFLYFHLGTEREKERAHEKDRDPNRVSGPVEQILIPVTYGSFSFSPFLWVISSSP